MTIEKVKKVNHAEVQILITEQQLSEFGNTIPVEKKEAIEKALEELKSVLENPDYTGIDEAMNKLSTVCQSASDDLVPI